MITTLKGGPIYTIDADNKLHISTTWMVMPGKSKSNSITGWLNFQNDVEDWAGKVGDYYKAPKQSIGSREVTSYDTDDKFVVTQINYSVASGRTHYEVTFDHEQNFEKMTQIGNVSVEVNNNNEIVKRIRYRITAENDVHAIDSFIIDSGTKIDWAGESFLVESSSYTSESATSYTLTISAIDMAYRMIGKPTFSTDGFGNKTASATWRMSSSKYASWDSPRIGSDASSYIGGEDGYIVTAINSTPLGVLGYNVVIQARYVKFRHVQTSVKQDANATAHTVVYQSDKSNISKFDGIINQIFTPTGEPVRSVDIQEQSVGDYRVTVNTSTNVIDLTKRRQITMSSGKFVLDETMCGYFKGESGQYYPINEPPEDKFTISMTLSELRKSMTDEQIATAIRNGKVGDSDIKKIYIKDGESAPISEPTDEKRGTFTATDVAKTLIRVYVSNYVHMQPMKKTDNGESVINPLFSPWKREDNLPLYTSKDINNEQDKYTDSKFDKPMPKEYIGKSIPTTEINVTLAYKMPIVNAMRASRGMFYTNAVKAVDSDVYVSYKGDNISMSVNTTPDGIQIVDVSCTLSALRKSSVDGKTLYWNSNLDTHEFVYNK